jgi:hypothetical protein
MKTRHASRDSSSAHRYEEQKQDGLTEERFHGRLLARRRAEAKSVGQRQVPIWKRRGFMAFFAQASRYGQDNQLKVLIFDPSISEYKVLPSSPSLEEEGWLQNLVVLFLQYLGVLCESLPLKC